MLILSQAVEQLQSWCWDWKSWFLMQSLAHLSLRFSQRTNLWMHRCADRGLNSAPLLQALLSKEVKSLMENRGIPCNPMFRLIHCNWALLSGILYRKRKQDEFEQLPEFCSIPWIFWGKSGTWFVWCCLHSRGCYLPCEPPDAASWRKQIPVLDKEYALPSKQNTAEFDPVAVSNLQSKLILHC